MKCQHCEKPATFHITELTEPNGPTKLHLCEDHVRTYLSQGQVDTEPASALADMLSKQLKLEQTAEDLSELDQKTCPMCGISFADFRKVGRLGCPYDYICFQEDIEELLMNIHGAINHSGKQPTRNTGSPDRQHQLIQLRKKMQSAIAVEDYETAGKLRDEIKAMESEAKVD